eukprot:TRINITY_DN12395_c0_g1_i1.p1 TRINITY_DN12395_c0_g1~~TRINITY_DN12395_c0_g1_i1.p1  ORF type:complete len:104 (+),score=8.40 TRINITY_DN12395_c0_g1_i1:26-313(+)
MAGNYFTKEWRHQLLNTKQPNRRFQSPPRSRCMSFSEMEANKAEKNPNSKESIGKGTKIASSLFKNDSSNIQKNSNSDSCYHVASKVKTRLFFDF